VAFRTFPAGSQPLRLDSAATGGFVGFLEMADHDQLMFLRVAASTDPGAAMGSAPPRIRLRADDGPAAKVPKAPDVVNIVDDEGEAIGSASWNVDEPGIYLVLLSIKRPGSIWQIELRNTAAEPANFTWTVANSDAESRQTWIHLPEILNFGFQRFGYSQTGTVDVINRGSRELTIQADSQEFARLLDERSFAAPNTNGVVVIPPHASASFDLAFQPRGYPFDLLFETEVEVTSDASNRASLRLRGLLEPIDGLRACPIPSSRFRLSIER